jgi:hypothetical protein
VVVVVVVVRMVVDSANGQLVLAAGQTCSRRAGIAGPPIPNS